MSDPRAVPEDAGFEDLHGQIVVLQETRDVRDRDRGIVPLYDERSLASPTLDVRDGGQAVVGIAALDLCDRGRDPEEIAVREFAVALGVPICMLEGRVRVTEVQPGMAETRCSEEIERGVDGILQRTARRRFGGGPVAADQMDRALPRRELGAVDRRVERLCLVSCTTKFLVRGPEVRIAEECIPHGVQCVLAVEEDSVPTTDGSVEVVEMARCLTDDPPPPSIVVLSSR